ncbi:hypothetical protein CO180_01705 [candidate division WWE3 bacterium CG_4_9_14_3_um_filter_41_6]|uniref:Uncharacterized protein n=1 Tax=candidate division WWE3 bacterium CG_4_10_14_0_2_um_filter_41_14 TaxID=1975072 RepID=A0A2M7TGD8_UNCKA|nr:MAG: hypothetical protein COY32_05690 [candidate division WWE3 bacterium CG_4_10_14_0_2_um_filter_41_14]PJA39036.1 MAG: hypothetical protein CO180_01705 [candidate division WWE3 bacterium CG_4_9_14_3_um_filter_41_6]
MNTFFYSHLVDTNDLENLLMKEDINDEQRLGLLATAHETIHIEVIHYILSNIPPSERHEFLLFVEQKPHDPGLLVYVKKSIEDAESKISQVIASVKQDFIEALDGYRDASSEWLSGVKV